MEKNILQNALNEFSQGTTDNIDSIMIKDAAGKQYWMKKADLASVLGGLSINQKLYPFMGLGDAVDLNTTINTGWYNVRANANNRPDLLSGYAFLIVTGSPKATQRIVQILIDDTGLFMFRLQTVSTVDITEITRPWYYIRGLQFNPSQSI